MPLLDTFWNRVDQEVSSKPRGRKDLERELRRLSKGRNQNTYTNWFKESRSPTQPRPNVRLSDLEDVAAALNVAPGALIAPVVQETRDSVVQLELPFGPDVRRISLELEATDSVLSMRISRSG